MSSATKIEQGYIAKEFLGDVPVWMIHGNAVFTVVARGHFPLSKALKACRTTMEDFDLYIERCLPEVFGKLRDNYPSIEEKLEDIEEKIKERFFIVAPEPVTAH